MQRLSEAAARERYRSTLKQVRFDAGLTQVELAERLNQPQSFVGKYESGERRVDFLELRLICDAVGIDIYEFVRRFERGAE